jgi:hypothetical protein
MQHGDAECVNDSELLVLLTPQTIWHQRKRQPEVGGRKMPLDGSDLVLFGNHPLAKLGAVESLLATEQQWCKGKMRDGDGRHCLVGAMHAVEARQILGAIILRAARQIGGKRYWRIEYFNDDPRTTHAHILGVLRLAREKIIAEMIEPDQRRPWRDRLAQVLRALCLGRVVEACTALSFEAHGPGSPIVATSFPVGQPAVLPCQSREGGLAAREACKVP